MKKIIPYILCVAFVISLVLGSCNNDNTTPTDPLVGKYIISSAVLAENLMYQGDTILPAGTDLTIAINVALLSAADCSDSTHTRIELKNNGQIWYVCEGENTGFQNGTWEITADRTQLSLALNIPQGESTVTADLKITDLQESTLQVSGTSTLPLPPEFFLAFGKDLTSSGVPVFQTTMNITITRMP